MNSKNKRIVVAVDFGTARSGYAFYVNMEQQIGIDLKNIYSPVDWEGSNLPYSKNLSMLLYKNKKPIQWGWAAKKKYITLKKKNAEEYSLMENFKMALIDKKIAEKLKYSDGTQADPIVVIGDFLFMLQQHLKSTFKSRLEEELTNQKTIWVITIPYIWNDIQKQKMIKALIHSKILSNNSVFDVDYSFCFEPEAAALYAHHTLKNISWNCNLIVDIGGGTSDITCVCIKNGIRILAMPTGGNSGSNYVNLEFENFCKKKFGSAVFTDIRKNKRKDFFTFCQTFETSKVNFNEDNFEDETTIDIPFGFYSFLEKSNKSLYEEFYEDEGMELSEKDIKSLFKKCFANIEHCIKAQVTALRIKGLKIDNIIGVGGFSESKYLQSFLRRKFKDEIKGKVIFPMRSSTAIVNGAALYGMYPFIMGRSATLNRISKHTYGISTCDLFEEGTHKKKKKIIMDGEEYCSDLFSAFVRAGDVVKTNMKVEKGYRPMHAFQKEVAIEIYHTEEKNPLYVDNCSGTLKFTIPLTSKTDSTILVSMFFGKTQIIISYTHDGITKKLKPQEFNISS